MLNDENFVNIQSKNYVPELMIMLALVKFRQVKIISGPVVQISFKHKRWISQSLSDTLEPLLD